jgi:lipoprotein-anchoring transpeptidase ErfK/SrfK
LSRSQLPARRRGSRLPSLATAALMTAGGLAGVWPGEGQAVPTPVKVPFVSAAPSPAVPDLPAPCAAPAPGVAELEEFLGRSGRFGPVVQDGRLAGADCDAVRAFQRWAEIPDASGAANATTVSVARRLASADLSKCAPAASGVTVCVDLTAQALWAFRDGKLAIAPTVVRTGRPGQATPTGRYRISQKKRHTVSSIYGTPLPFWQRFYRDFGLHAAETPMYAPIPGSHGCVNMLRRDAGAVFELTSIGSVVHVFGRKPGT